MPIGERAATGNPATHGSVAGAIKRDLAMVDRECARVLGYPPTLVLCRRTDPLRCIKFCL
jgi:hypothetical protein